MCNARCKTYIDIKDYCELTWMERWWCKSLQRAAYQSTDLPCPVALIISGAMYLHKSQDFVSAKSTYNAIPKISTTRQ